MTVAAVTTVVMCHACDSTSNTAGCLLASSPAAAVMHCGAGAATQATEQALL